MGKIDTKPQFGQGNPPPAPGAHSHDTEKNSYLRFYHKVLSGDEENVKKVPAMNTPTGNPELDNPIFNSSVQNIVLAVGKFLALAARGAVVHGQSIGTNAEATAALDNLFNCYEQYHNILEEIRANTPSGATGTENSSISGSEGGEKNKSTSEPASTVVKFGGFKPKTPATTTEPAKTEPTGTNSSNSGGSTSETVDPGTN